MGGRYDTQEETCYFCGLDVGECICPEEWDPEELDYLDGFQNLDWPDEPKENEDENNESK